MQLWRILLYHGTFIFSQSAEARGKNVGFNASRFLAVSGNRHHISFTLLHHLLCILRRCSAFSPAGLNLLLFHLFCCYRERATEENKFSLSRSLLLLARWLTHFSFVQHFFLFVPCD